MQQPTLRLLEDGAGLHEALCDVLLAERTALVNHTLDELTTVGQRRDQLLQQLDVWSAQARGQLADPVGPSPEVPTLGRLLDGLDEPAQGRGRASLERLRAHAEQARELAASNHILVARNLDLVSRTLAFYTGGSVATTYNANGGVADDPGRPVVEARG